MEIWDTGILNLTCEENNSGNRNKLYHFFDRLSVKALPHKECDYFYEIPPPFPIPQTKGGITTYYILLGNNQFVYTLEINSQLIS